MIINNNIPALNNYRQMGANQAAGQNSMEKLASGLRINNAADDAAGLAISEKMRAQIRGLDQASRNAQDGISMIQTAEGALQETQDILQRMRELATQAANDTNVDVDREEIQKELNQLTSEINRIGNTTEFNTQNLLDGGVAQAGGVTADGDFTYTLDTTLTLGAAGDDNAGTGGDAVNFENGDYSLVAVDDYEGTALTNDDVEGGDATAVTHVLVDSSGEAVGSSTNGTEFHALGDVNENQAGDGAPGTRASFTISGSPTQVSIEGTDVTATYSGDFAVDQSIGDGTYTVVDDTDPNVTSGLGLADADGNIVAFSADGETWTTEEGSGDTVLTTETLSAGAEITVDSSGGSGDGFEATFQIGANNGQSMTIEINDMRAAALGIAGTSGGAHTGGDNTKAEAVDGAAFTADNDVTNGTTNTGEFHALDVSDHEKASAAIEVINNAIEAVSAERSQLGANQNRLEHTISNLGNASENLSAAESRIRDVDMAREMMEMTKSNILSQASQSMLAQANQAPQSVLQLLG